MRFVSTLALAGASLLAKGVLSGPIGTRPMITNKVIVLEQIVVTAYPDGSHKTGKPKAIATNTIHGFVVITTVKAISTLEDPPATTPLPKPVPTAIEPPKQPDGKFKEIPKPIDTAPPAPPAPAPTKPVEVKKPAPPPPPPAPTKAAEEKKPAPPPKVEKPAPVKPIVAPAPAPLPETIVKAPAPISVPNKAPVNNGPKAPSGAGKRGIAYNDINACNSFKGNSKFTWAYNWGGSSTPKPAGVEFIPTLWGVGEHANNWEKWASEAIAAGSKHLFSFNEPDIPSQANIGVGAAVDGYKKHMQPFAGKAQLGAPSVSNGGGEMGLTWLGNFLGACNGCTIDFVNIHWYNGGNPAAFKEHIEKAARVAGGRKIWITEFEAPGSPAEKLAWLDEVLPYLDSNPAVERYSYFMAAEGFLVSGGALNEVGKKYAF